MLVVILSNKEKYKVSSALRASVTLINTRIYNGIFYFLASFLSFFRRLSFLEEIDFFDGSAVYSGGR